MTGPDDDFEAAQAEQDRLNDEEHEAAARADHDAGHDGLPSDSCPTCRGDEP